MQKNREKDDERMKEISTPSCSHLSEYFVYLKERTQAYEIVSVSLSQPYSELDDFYEMLEMRTKRRTS
jgi:hypothetical protein